MITSLQRLLKVYEQLLNSYYKDRREGVEDFSQELICAQKWQLDRPPLLSGFEKSISLKIILGIEKFMTPAGTPTDFVFMEMFSEKNERSFTLRH